MYEEKKKSPWLLITIVLVIIAIAVAAFLILRPGNNSNNNQNANVTPTPTAIVTNTPTPTATTTDDLDPTPTTTVVPSTSSTPVITATPTPTSSGPRKVNVYYSQGENPTNPSSSNSLKTPGYSVYRIFTSSRGDIENFVMEKTIAGPSDADKSAYYWFNPITLTGESNCGGKDFTLTNNTTTNRITVQFCKAVTTAGVGDDARITTVIKNGLNPLLSVDAAAPAGKVIILTQDGNCLGDQSGKNVCKN
jgi:flagellar basal body-associated protein FliL